MSSAGIAAPAQHNQAAKKAATRTTTYIILEIGTTSSETPRLWKERGQVQAISAVAAIRKHVEPDAGLEGTFVAIPARSWQPVKVSTETKTSVKLEPHTG